MNHQRQFSSVFFAFILALVAILVLAPFEAQPADAQFVRKPGAKLRLCYMYFGTLTDLGYTFAFHKGRLQAQEVLTAKYPDIIIESVYENNVFFSGMNRTQNMLNYANSGCHMIITNAFENFMTNDFTWDFSSYFAQQYRNISFLVGGDSNKALLSTEPNMIWSGTDYVGTFFKAGVAAAHEATQCVGVIAAYENRVGININSLIKGIRSVKPNLKIEVVTIDTWWWPDGDTRITKLLIERGCNVIVHNTDSRDTDLVVAGTKTFGAEKYFSIGVHSNLQEYVGDTVLTAIYNNWVNIIVPWVSDVIEKGVVQQFDAPKYYGLNGDYVRNSPISPLASPSTTNAVHSLGLVNENNVYCGEITLRDGTKWTPPVAGGCMTIKDRREFLVKYLQDADTTYHPIPFRLETECAAGSYYTYSTTGPLTLTCTVCPTNTFSASAGSAVCTPCPAGEHAVGSNNTRCRLIPPPTDNTGLYAGIAIAAAVLVLAVLAVVVLKVLKAAKTAAAPRDGSKFFSMFVQLKNETVLWEKKGDMMVDVMTEYHKVLGTIASKNNCYVVKNIGGATLVTSTSADAILACAATFNKEVNGANWLRFVKDKEAASEYTRENRSSRGAGGSSKKYPGGVRDTGSEAARRRKRRERDEDARSECSASSRLSSTTNGEERFAVQFGIGINVDKGFVKYDEEKNAYDYSGASVDGAAVCSDNAQGCQILAASTVTQETTIDEAQFMEFRAVEFNGKEQVLMQYNPKGQAVRHFDAEAKGAGANNVDSIAAVLEQQSSGVTKKKVTVLSVYFHGLEEKSKTYSRERFGTYYHDKYTLIEELLAMEKGFIHSWVGPRLVISFNAVAPTPQAVYRAFVVADKLQQMEANEGYFVTCGLASEIALVGSFTSPTASSNSAAPTHHAIVSQVVENANYLQTLCSKYGDCFCVASQQLHDEISCFAVEEIVDIDRLPNQAVPKLVLAVHELKPEVDSDEWMYELQAASSNNVYEQINKAFEAILKGGSGPSAASASEVPANLQELVAAIPEEMKGKSTGYHNLMKLMGLLEKATDKEVALDEYICSKKH